MAVNPILDLTAPSIQSYVYVKTNVGGWFFDAFLQLTHTSELVITSDPVQLGSSVTDFAYMKPRTLSINIGMSDSAKSFIPGQFAGGWSRSVTAFQILQQLQIQRIPIQILTRLGLYQNMLVETLTAQDDFATKNALRATVDFQELLVATVKTVKISANPAVTDSKSSGTKQPSQPNQSILSIAESIINGTYKPPGS